MHLATSVLAVACLSWIQTVQAWSPIIVKNVTLLGPQLAPDVTNVSRDGGYSALINDKIVWLYDDTECFDSDGDQLSFVSNTAAYQNLNNNNDVSTVTDFGVVNLGKDQNGSPKTAILAGTTVGEGGWIPFQPDELDFNGEMMGRERVAIWPGTSPTSISTTEAFLYAPLVYVDSKPQDPSKEYQARGMTLISITAPEHGPLARRQGNLIIPGTEVPFGGFSTLLGFRSTGSAPNLDNGERDVYLFGITNRGLQLARVGVNDLTEFTKFTFWNPKNQKFSSSPPNPSVSDAAEIYLPGTFSSGSILYSPYFETFIMVYFNKMADSTFYIRYLQLNVPLGGAAPWTAGGKAGKGILAEDTEALVKYAWSAEQVLYASPPGPGGFNYAGIAHPEFFNKQYYAQSLYSPHSSKNPKTNTWYGPISQKSAGGDGRNLLLSWTSQKGGMGSGIYEVQLAVVTFDDIPPNLQGGSTPADSSNANGLSGHEPVSTVVGIAGKANTIRLPITNSRLSWFWIFVMAHLLFFAGVHRDIAGVFGQL